jgi:hypothetical protein
MPITSNKKCLWWMMMKKREEYDQQIRRIIQRAKKESIDEYPTTGDPK